MKKKRCPTGLKLINGKTVLDNEAGTVFYHKHLTLEARRRKKAARRKRKADSRKSRRAR